MHLGIIKITYNRTAQPSLGMGDMGLKIYHGISGIYCDNDINDNNSGNPVSLEKSIIFPILSQIGCCEHY